MTEDTHALLKGTYDVHTKFTYSFQARDYVNKARAEMLATEMREKPGLAGVIVRSVAGGHAPRPRRRTARHRPRARAAARRAGRRVRPGRPLGRRRGPPARGVRGAGQDGARRPRSCSAGGCSAARRSRCRGLRCCGPRPPSSCCTPRCSCTTTSWTATACAGASPRYTRATRPRRGRPAPPTPRASGWRSASRPATSPSSPRSPRSPPSRSDPCSRAGLSQRVGRELALVAAGQLEDVALGADRRWPSRAAVLAVYTYKTARYTFSLPLACGALLAGASPATVARLERFGELLGTVFQVLDDDLGMFGTEEETGQARRRRHPGGQEDAARAGDPAPRGTGGSAAACAALREGGTCHDATCRQCARPRNGSAPGRPCWTRQRAWRSKRSVRRGAARRRRSTDRCCGSSARRASAPSLKPAR